MNRLGDRIAKQDFILAVIETVGRGGRWLLELSFCCIFGCILIGGLGTVLLVVAPLVSLDATRIVPWMPATGWWIGFLLGMLRLKPCLSSSFGSPDDSDSSSSKDEGAESAEPNDPTVIESPSLIRRVKSGANSMAFGALFGGIAGVFLTLYCCIAATAIIMSPVAPKAWHQQMKIEAEDLDSINHPDRIRRRRSTGPVGLESSSEFWHPVYVPIFVTCAGTCVLLGLGLGGYAGWVYPTPTPTSDTD